MNFYEQEMRMMFGSKKNIKEAKFCGKVMLAKLNDELRVKLQFVEMGYANHYSAIRMTIINRKDGELDTITFRFEDIIGLKAMRSGDKVEPYMWTYNNESWWYTPVMDAEKKKIADTINGFISMYQ